MARPRKNANTNGNAPALPARPSEAEERWVQVSGPATTPEGLASSMNVILDDEPESEGAAVVEIRTRAAQLPAPRENPPDSAVAAIRAALESGAPTGRCRPPSLRSGNGRAARRQRRPGRGRTHARSGAPEGGGPVTREEWLNQLTALLRPLFEAAGAPLPAKLRVSCGWPSAKALASPTSQNRTIGQCWPTACSADVTPEVFISPCLSEPLGRTHRCAEDRSGVNETTGNYRQAELVGRAPIFRASSSTGHSCYSGRLRSGN